MSKQRGQREATDVRHAEVKVKHAEPIVEATREKTAAEIDREERPHLYWPKGVAKPTRFERRRPALPCPKCERVQTDLGGKAVVCDRGVSEKSGKAYLTCHVCRQERRPVVEDGRPGEFSMPLG